MGGIDYLVGIIDVPQEKIKMKKEIVKILGEAYDELKDRSRDPFEDPFEDRSRDFAGDPEKFNWKPLRNGAIIAFVALLCGGAFDK